MTCEDSNKRTFLPELEDGRQPCTSQDGPMLDLFGQEVRRASPSAQRAKAQGAQIPGTCGPFTSTSSASADLQRSLESKLQQRLATGGSTLFKMTWRAKVTPSQRSYYQLVASAHRTSDSGCGSWQTPKVSPGKYSYQNGDHSKPFLNLEGQVQLASWPGLHGDGGADLRTQASWATPAARDHKDTGDMSQSMVRKNGRLRNDTIGRQSFGVTSNGSPPATVKPGQLNPAFSLWLMGYPAKQWLCAAQATLSSRKSPPK